MKSWLRYNRVVRWLLVRIKRKWIGNYYYEQLLDYLYPDDSEITFKP